jgi:hypothetical protein
MTRSKSLVRYSSSAGAVQVVHARPPTGGVPFGDDPMDTVRREKPVVDALAQAVLVDRIAEILVAVAVVFPLWRSGHAKLVGRFEVFENQPP